MSLDDYRLSYEINPIVFVGGIAQNMPGGKAAISNFTDSGLYPGGLTSPATAQNKSALLNNNANTAALTADDYFAHFYPEMGDLWAADIAHWPLANQAVAANAVITKPLQLALIMVCPAKGDMTLTQKQSILTSLQNTVQQHITQGGWFDVATPSLLYQGMLCPSISIMSDQIEGGQVQSRYRWVFEQPVITQQQAQAAYNTSMGKIAGGTQVGGDPPGSSPPNVSVGQPGSNVSQNVVPAAANPQAGNVTPPGGGSSSGTPIGP